MKKRMKNLINCDHFFLVGKPIKSSKWELMRMSKTDNGWTQRCSTPGFDVDYVSNENVKDLKDWFACDYNSYHTFTNIEDAREYHQSKHV